MVLFRRIVVAVDFSDFSQEALRISAGLARACGEEVLVLHVCNAPKALDPTLMAAQGRAIRSLIELQKEMSKLAEKKIDDWIGHYEWGEAEIEREVLTGSSYKQIAKRAREYEADLIVMGSYGRSGFARMLIGSTTEKVLRKAGCPVMAVTIPAVEAKKPEGS